MRPSAANLPFAVVSYAHKRHGGLRMSDYTDLLYEVADNVATITLNRPDRLNAISGPMLDSFSRALRDADLDPAVRVIIITGAGRGFCAGLDLKDQMSGTGIGSSPSTSPDGGLRTGNGT